MNEENEKDQQWVDELLTQLPSPTPVPEDISRHFDQFLAERVAELQAQSNVVSLNSSRSSSRASGSFTRRYQFILAAAAVTGLLAFVGTQSSLFNSNSDRSSVASQENSPNDEPIVESNSQPEEEPSVTESPAEDKPKDEPSNSEPAEQTPSNGNSSEMVDPEAATTEIQVLGSEGGTGYLPTDAPDVQVTRSGLDYATQLEAILKKVAPYGDPGKVNKLNKSQLNCIVQLKLVDRVIAVDSGKFNGSNVVTFFAFADDGTTKAYVTVPGENCSLVKKISIN